MSQQPSFSPIKFMLICLGLGGYLGYWYSGLPGALFGLFAVFYVAALLFPKAVLAAYGGSKVVRWGSIITVYLFDFMFLVGTLLFWSRISTNPPLYSRLYLIAIILGALTLIANIRFVRLRIGRNANSPLMPIDFTYQLPEGWIEFKKSLKVDELAVLIRPPDTASLLELHVYQYMEESVTDQEQFKSVTYRNLLERGATIVEDKISMRHGVISHETSFKIPKIFTSYGIVVCFVIRNNLFLIMLSSSNIETFRRYRPKMEEFIESLRFT